jgi:hypothetical protein
MGKSLIQFQEGLNCKHTRNKQLLGNLKNSLRGTFHKLHPNHLARHLATFAYRFNRRFSLHNMVTRLLFVGLRTPPVPRRMITVDSG